MVDKKSILPFIKAQLPKHITDSASLFPSFVEAYYEWLNRPDNVQHTLYTLSTITNIDKSIDAFTEEFFSEYLKNFPTNLLTDKALTIKHIVDLYKAKGTPAAYKLLFRILYNDKIDIIYPGDYVFKPSDNRWIQDFTFFVTVTRGSAPSLVGEEVVVNTVNGTVIVFVERVKFIRDGYYQVFIDKNYIGTIAFGDTVSFGDTLCVIAPTTTKVRIKQKGSGFKLGDIFLLADGIGYGSTVKVSKIDDNGGILAVTFIEYGVGYKSNFEFNVSTASTSVTDTVIPGVNTTVNDYIKNIIDSGYIVQNNYVAVDYSEPTYIGAILSTFYAETANALDPNSAVFSVEIGAIAKYLGYYENNKSFPSDTIYLHDGEYYQTYSYVINSQIQFNEYKDILKNLIHPAGFALFGQYEITNNFDIGASLQNLINSFKLALLDIASVSDDIMSFDIAKELVDSTSITDFLALVATKVLSDSSSVSDTAPTLTFNKAIDDSVTVLDAIDYINSQNNGLADSSSALDITALLITKSFIDDLVSFTDIKSLNFGKSLSDATDPLTDVAALTLTKVLTDSVTITDAIDYINRNNVLADSTSYSDFISTAFTKVLSDATGTLTDTTTLSFDKSLSDALAGLSDVTSMTLTKVLEDSVTVTDALDSIIPTYTSTDSASTSDVSSFAFTKALDDSVTQSETYAYSINKVLQDTFGITETTSIYIAKSFDDSFVPSDDLSINISKSFTETLSSTDDYLLTFTKILVDSIVSDDAGSIWINPYVLDTTSYFAEDYMSGITLFT